MIGSERKPVTPNEPSDGPTARIKTFFGVSPSTTTPGISTASPEPTTARDEI